MEGAAVGRNMPAIPKEERNPRTGPNVQVIAQRLLARESFQPAGAQLNVVAAAWIQSMVHDWMKHVDGNMTSIEAKPAQVGSQCPLRKFKFAETLERPDGWYDSERTMWWDASFVYGQNEEQVKNTRSYKGGKLLVNENNPDTLPHRADGTDKTGDQSNSWIGVTVLQNIFLKEHNFCAEQIAKENPDLTDEEIYGYCRNIISALVAKIHTIDWTVELLKTNTLRIGMETNWKGITKALFGDNFPLFNSALRLIKKSEDDNRGVPFCLTEEFAAVYRLHPLLPPGLVVEEPGDTPNSFIPLKDCLTAKGRDNMRKPGMAPKLMDSCFHYPCGHLVASNYPDAIRDMMPTDHKGVDIGNQIDLATIDLFRDRERGIQYFNNFRRQLKMKPYKTWEALTGDKKMTSAELEDFKAGKEGANLTNAKKLELVYGPAPEGLEKLDLLVGDLYEDKINGFAISETSFMIFLLMASRRLDSDPYLNQYLDEEHYTKFGVEHVEEVGTLRALLKRHYPDLESKFPEGQSVFKPIYGPDEWKKHESLYQNDIANWNKTKQENDVYFRGVLQGN
jgi:alpha-dioxygenase